MGIGIAVGIAIAIVAGNADWGDRPGYTADHFRTPPTARTVCVPAQPAGRVGTFPFCRRLGFLPAGKFMHVFSTWHLPGLACYPFGTASGHQWECIQWCLQAVAQLPELLDRNSKFVMTFCKYELPKSKAKTHVCQALSIPVYVCVCVLCICVFVLCVSMCVFVFWAWWQFGISVAQLINCRR